MIVLRCRYLPVLLVMGLLFKLHFMVRETINNKRRMKQTALSEMLNKLPIKESFQKSNRETNIEMVTQQVSHLTTAYSNKEIIHNINKSAEQKTNYSIPNCKKGFFKLNGMKECRKWLECHDITPMMNHFHLLGSGLYKMVYLVEWKEKSLKLALFETKHKTEQSAVERVKIALRNVLELQPSNHVIQLVGYCEIGNKTIYLTEYCEAYGTMNQFVLSQDFQNLSSKQKFKLAINLVETFVLLHHGSSTKKIHCGLHSNLKEAMKQYLVTDDMRIVLGDVDELPEYDPQRSNSTQCWSTQYCKMSDENFLAPEERYSVEQCQKNIRTNSSVYSNVWKIPNFSLQLLDGDLSKPSQRHELRNIRMLLEPIHKQCKNIDAQKRPTSEEILKQYKLVFYSTFYELFSVIV